MTGLELYYLSKKQKQRIYECHSSIWLAPDGFVYRRGSFMAWPVCPKTHDISVFKPDYRPSQTGNTTVVSYKLISINLIEPKTILEDIIASGVCFSWVTEKQPGPGRAKRAIPLSSNCQFVASSTVDTIIEAGGRVTKAHFYDQTAGGYLIFLPQTMTKL